jgi:alanyl-tRNA synthetase
MTTKELKEKYLKFFEEKGHKVIPGASLIPEHDPTVLFTTAGMHPLIPYLLGEKHPAGDKLVNVQKCIRTSDIEKVGNDTHLTFFEMLGNWGLGSYWKKEAIKWSWEFLTDKKWLGLDSKKISVSVFKGQGGIPRDNESAEIWKSLGAKEIKFLGKDENFWGPAGKTGPCGPCTEMFYNDIEIWNDVFMEYNKKIQNPNAKVQKYEYVPLEQKNVDTGMGVERTVAVLNNKKSVYDIEPLKSILEKARELKKSSYAKASEDKSERIIADHIRAACFILAEEIMPSNLERGYVLRRLVRRAIRYARKIGIKKPFTHEIAKIINVENKDFIIEQLVREEERFSKTLEKGLREFEKGTDPFILFTTYGFPIEMTEELAKEKGIKIDKKKFEKQFKKHQELSRTATAGKFKSGLADHSKEVTKLHTATHLLLAALRKVLGNHVYQKGSNITGERLRLDFSYSEKLTDEQIKKVEDLVNEQIKKDIPIKCEEMSLDNAKKKGAIGVFEAKYGNKVKVYSVGQFSKEICSGPHVKKTGELGHFKITKQESSSAGVRRIKAVLK